MAIFPASSVPQKTNTLPPLHPPQPGAVRASTGAYGRLIHARATSRPVETSAIARFVARATLGTLVVLACFVSPAWGQASSQGQWSTVTSYQIPINPIHVTLLNTGNILVVAGSGNCAPFEAGCPAGPPYGPANGSGVLLLDPRTGNITQFSLPWDMFCNGMVTLPDGRAFINGGTIHYDPFFGAPNTTIFDPASNGFTDAPDMAHGRWYPTVLTLSDGRMMTFSGTDETGRTNAAVEIYTPGQGWSPEYVAPWTPDLYPWLHLLPNGKVFYAGAIPTSAMFDPSTHTWTTGIANANYAGVRQYGSSVLLPLLPSNNYDPKVIILGGGDPSTATTETIDLGTTPPVWMWGPEMSQPRIEMNAVILPNQKVLALGGSYRNEDATTASLNADLYDPAANTFSSAGANALPRLYHSVALLLPDATVWVAGSNPARGTYEPRVEIYKPSYLFNASNQQVTQPTITSAPTGIAYGQAFTVQTNASGVSSVALIRDGSSTHAFGMDQRMVGLVFTATGLGGGTSLNVTAPPNGNIAPPGYYMLFVLDTAGVPSIAKIVHVGPLSQDFSVTASPYTTTVFPGGSTQYTVSVHPLGAFNGTVALSATGLPAGATATFNPGSLTGSGTSTLTITSDTSTPAGTYPLTIQGTSGQTHTDKVMLVVATTAATPAFNPVPGSYSGGVTVALSDTTQGAVIHCTTDGSTPTAASPICTSVTVLSTTTIKAIAVASGLNNSAVATGAYTIVSATQPITYGNGFTAAGMQLNGSAVLNGTRLRLTGAPGQAGSAFFTAAVNVQSFTTSFSIQLTAPTADGMAFVIQNSGLTALGSAGGGLGFSGIPNSLAVKFDLYNNQGEGNNSTGLYTAGAAPSTPAIDLTPSGVNLHSGDIFNVQLVYNGTKLTMTITDASHPAQTFTTSWTVNIPASVAGNIALVGFTGGTGGGSATQEVINWTYGTQTNPAPTVASVAPTSGTAAGGTPITVTGTGFLAGATVSLGGTAATNVVVSSGTKITATTPVHAAGAVNVVVINTDGQAGTLANGYTYNPVGNPAPTVASVAPNSGAASGGTPITITGTGFLAGATVSLGGTAATNVVVSSGTTITATTPAHAAGAVNVVVTNTDAQAGTLANGYTYTTATVATPTFSPAPGNYTGGQTVTLSDSTPGAVIHCTTDGSTPTAASPVCTTVNVPATATIKAIAVATGLNNSAVATGTYTIVSGTQPISYGTGFTAAGMQLNGGAALNGTRLRVTSAAQQGAATSAYFSTPVNVQSFTTSFSFQLTAANADGMAFVIQNQGLTAVGSAGGGLGYTGIPKSVAVKFDLYDNLGEGNDSTGLYTLGQSIAIPAIDMTPSGVNLHSGDIFNVQLVYDGTKLTLTITDASHAAQTFTTNWTVNIPAAVGGNTALVGFTGGTGGLTATQEIISWTYGTQTNPAPTVASVAPTSGTAAGGTPITITGTGFLAGATVSLGGTAATNVVVSSATTITATTPAHAAGAVNVVVTNTDAQAGTLANGYTYNPVGNPAPTVASVAPTSGTAAGGTPITITGTGFLAGATVSLGGTAATNVVVSSATTITATTPAHAAGAVNVVVTNTDAQAGTLANGYTYNPVGNPAPTVASVAPTSGTAAGGTPITITGTGFLAGATVSLGGTAATNVVVSSATTITATTPAHAAGAVNVVVTNTDAQAGTLANGYTYNPVGNPAPTVASVAPTSGTAAGGTPITITGTGFLAGATVSLGGTAATNVVVSSATTITATTPAHAAGAVNVVVTNTDAQAGTLANGYTYVSGTQPISYGTGFTAAGMQLNGGAALNGTRLRVTSAAQQGAATSAYFSTPVNVQSFTTSFSFQLTAANADGMAFVIQNQGLTAVGSAGGGLGYTGIPKSVAVKFDLYDNLGEGNDSTGLYTLGQSIAIPAIDMTPSGVNLHSGDIFNVQLVYDGTKLTLTITDASHAAQTFTTNWTVNIPAAVGGNTALVGFTGGTGGLTATQEIISWIYSTP